MHSIFCLPVSKIEQLMLLVTYERDSSLKMEIAPIYYPRNVDRGSGDIFSST